MASGYYKDDPIEGIKDLDDEYVTDAWLIDQFVGNQIFSWGYNFHGQLGLGDTVHRSSPVQIGSLVNWKSVSSPNIRTYPGAIATKTDGTLWAWGYNVQGQLGLGDTTNRSSPVQIGSLTTWKNVNMGGTGTGSFSLAIKTDGSLWAWGYNTSFGTLGLGDTTNRSSPVQVGNLTNWKNVSSGDLHSIAVKTDGTLWAWGLASVGQLALGSPLGTNISTPVQVGTLTDWRVTSAGYRNSCSVKADGTLWAWGYNTTGQLGVGDDVHRSSPTQVGSLTTWKQVVTSTHTLAIKNNGTLWAWGANSSGQLGLNDYAHRSSPVQVGSLTTWKTIAVNSLTDLVSGTSAATKTDGTLWTWGYNTNGELGTGDTVVVITPVQIGTLTNWKQVGDGATYAITYKDIG